MALGATQPLAEMSTRNTFLGVKRGRCFHVPIVLKFVSLNLLEPSRPVQACNEIALPLPLLLHNTVVHWLKLTYFIAL